jgi:hypothetical protein
MIDDEVVKSFNAIRASFYQPLSEEQAKAWHRYLPTIRFDDFKEALKIVVANGGSQTASAPGQRPSVAEFAATVRMVAHHRIQHEDQARREFERAQEPDTPPEVASQRIAEIKESLTKERVRG